MRDADQILVLAGGRVEETGTHAELLASSGRYAALAGAQARGLDAELEAAGEAPPRARIGDAAALAGKRISLTCRAS